MTLHEAMNELENKFDALLIKEVKLFGGVPTHIKAEIELREAIATTLKIYKGE